MGWQGWDSASHFPPRVKFSSRARGKSDWKLLKVSNNPEGRKNLQSSREELGCHKFSQPLSRSVHKFIGNGLWVRLSLLHPRQIPFPCRKRPGFHAEIMLLTRREKEKRPWGVRIVLGHFQTPSLKSVFLRIPTGAAARLIRLAAAFPNSFPDFIPAVWLLLGQPEHLLIPLGTCHPHGAKPAPAARNHPGISPAKAGKEQGCAGILPWECPWRGLGSCTEGLRCWGAGEVGASPAAGSTSQQDPGGHRGPLLGVTCVRHVRPP